MARPRYQPPISHSTMAKLIREEKHGTLNVKKECDQFRCSKAVVGVAKKDMLASLPTGAENVEPAVLHVFGSPLGWAFSLADGKGSPAVQSSAVSGTTWRNTLMACVAAIESIPEGTPVLLVTQMNGIRYVLSATTLEQWRRADWMAKGRQRADIDLLERLVVLLKNRVVSVLAHSGPEMNPLRQAIQQKLPP